MKNSLAKDLIRYARTKGRAPLDERQMNTLKDIYVELAKSALIGMMLFLILYGYMDMRGMDTGLSFLNIGTSYIGTLAYYYFLRICYQQVIGIDVNFEIIVIPALFFTPSLCMNTLHILGLLFEVDDMYHIIVALLWPLYSFLLYAGANRVYQKGQLVQEYQMEHGELHFRSRKQIVNYVIIILVLLALLPISYDALFQVGIIACTIFTCYMIWYYGFHTPSNEYILNEAGLRFTRALWNRKGGFIPYEEIIAVDQRDTFNIGYSKDKVCIRCKDGKEIMLYPENAYQFCVELENNR